VSDCEHDVCITCGDVAVAMRVVRLDGDLAVCEAADGDVRTVEVALLDGVTEGDTLLVHADVALAYGRPDGAVRISRGRTPRGGDSR
jgi:hydrogenase expression/formation protein HypC